MTVSGRCFCKPCTSCSRCNFLVDFLRSSVWRCKVYFLYFLTVNELNEKFFGLTGKGEKMRGKSGFTLVEILIVVVILGILAAIVIPQFSEASSEAKLSSLVSDLQTMRSQIELYKIQHTDQLPGSGAATFEQAMTGYTDVLGAVAAGPGAGVYGPYMQKIPTNQFNNLDTVEIEAGSLGIGGGNCGWHFNSTPGYGTFYADTDAHTSL